MLNSHFIASGESKFYEEEPEVVDGSNFLEREPELVDRDARADGNSYFLRPLRARTQHFLRALKKRGIKSGGDLHFLRSLR